MTAGWELLRCPRCRDARLTMGELAISCPKCKERWPVLDGRIPYFAASAVERSALLRQEVECQDRAFGVYEDRASVLYHWDGPSLRALEAMFSGRGGPVLDLGCGTGRFAAEFPHHEVFAVDIAPALLGLASKRAALAVGADARELPFEAESFPLAIARGLLHHVEQPEAVLRELLRVLQPGGQLVLFDPRAWPGLEWIKRRLRRRSKLHSSIHRGFGRSEYRAMIESSGFEIVRFEDWDPVGLLFASCIDLLHLGRWGTAGLYRACERLDRMAARALQHLGSEARFGLTMAVVARKPEKAAPPAVAAPGSDRPTTWSSS